MRSHYQSAQLLSRKPLGKDQVTRRVYRWQNTVASVSLHHPQIKAFVHVTKV